MKKRKLVSRVGKKRYYNTILRDLSPEDFNSERLLLWRCLENAFYTIGRAKRTSEEYERALMKNRPKKILQSIQHRYREIKNIEKRDRRWFASNRKSYLQGPGLTFLKICHYLGLDPKLIRENLEKIVDYYEAHNVNKAHFILTEKDEEDEQRFSNQRRRIRSVGRSAFA